MQPLFTLLFQMALARLKSRTYLFALLLLVFGVIQQFAPLVQGMLDPSTYGLVVAVIGAIVAALREVTTQPLGVEPEPAPAPEQDAERL